MTTNTASVFRQVMAKMSPQARRCVSPDTASKVMTAQRDIAQAVADFRAGQLDEASGRQPR